MTDDDDYFTCPHIYRIHTTSCMYCGRPQCDLCRKKHEEYHHVQNNDKKLRHEDLE